MTQKKKFLIKPQATDVSFSIFSKSKVFAYKYKFRVITSEHNFTQNREKIYTLLKKQGYERKFEDISEFDDWYVLTN